MLTSAEGGGAMKSQPPAEETVTLTQSAKFGTLLVHDSISTLFKIQDLSSHLQPSNLIIPAREDPFDGFINHITLGTLSSACHELWQFMFWMGMAS
jgi:hypothetical protein